MSTSPYNVKVYSKDNPTACYMTSVNCNQGYTLSLVDDRTPFSPAISGGSGCETDTNFVKIIVPGAVTADFQHDTYELGCDNHCDPCHTTNGVIDKIIHKHNCNGDNCKPECMPPQIEACPLFNGFAAVSVEWDPNDPNLPNDDKSNEWASDSYVICTYNRGIFADLNNTLTGGARVDEMNSENSISGTRKIPYYLNYNNYAVCNVPVSDYGDCFACDPKNDPTCTTGIGTTNNCIQTTLANSSDSTSINYGRRTKGYGGYQAMSSFYYNYVDPCISGSQANDLKCSSYLTVSGNGYSQPSVTYESSGDKPRQITYYKELLPTFCTNIIDQYRLNDETLADYTFTDPITAKSVQRTAGTYYFPPGSGTSASNAEGNGNFWDTANSTHNIFGGICHGFYNNDGDWFESAWEDTSTNHKPSNYMLSYACDIYAVDDCYCLTPTMNEIYTDSVAAGLSSSDDACWYAYCNSISKNFDYLSPEMRDTECETANCSMVSNVTDASTVQNGVSINQYCGSS